MPAAPIPEITSTFYYVTYTMNGSTYSTIPQSAGATAARIRSLEQQDSVTDIRVVESQVTTRERYIDPADLRLAARPARAAAPTAPHPPAPRSSTDVHPA